jgi:type II secretion system protein I
MGRNVRYGKWTPRLPSIAMVDKVVDRFITSIFGRRNAADYHGSRSRPCERRQYNKQSGITLLELVVATAILGMSLTALAIAVGRCLQGFSAANNAQVAVDLAEGRFAQLKMKAEDDTSRPQGEEGELTIQGRKFIWHEEIDLTEDQKLYKASVSVGWLEGGIHKERTFIGLLQKGAPKPLQ